MLSSAGIRKPGCRHTASAFALCLVFAGCSGGSARNDGQSDAGVDSAIGEGRSDRGGGEDLAPNDDAISLNQEAGQTSGLTVTPASLDFGTVDVGQVSPASVVTVKNAGVPVPILPTVTGAGFAIDSTTCGAATASCTISLVFSPISFGPASGLFTVVPGLTVSLSGTGVGGHWGIAPTMVPTTVLVNQSVPVSVTVTSSGALVDLACMPSGADLTADPANTTCGADVAANTPCVYAFTFKATKPGSANDSIVCSTGGVVKTVPVAPTVISGKPGTLTPNPASFSECPGRTSSSVTLTFANSGGSASGNLGAAIAGANASEFVIVDNTCLAPLAPFSTCAIQVVFEPKAVGARIATLTMTDATAGSIPAVASLNGFGAYCDPSPIVGPTDLGSVQVGAAGTPVIYSFSNPSGSATPALTVVASNAEFAIGDDQCTGLPLPPATSCTFTVTFSPTSVGVQTAVLTLSGGMVSSLFIQGTGVSSSAPALAVSPASVNFGMVSIGETSLASVVTVTNKGAPVAIGPTVTGPGFTIDSTTCGTATASCTIRLKFAPASVGAASGLLTVAPGLTVSLSGEGTLPPSFSVVPSVVPPTVLVNQSVPVSVTVITTGVATDLSCLPSGADLTADPADTTCAAIVAANTPCVYAFTFKAKTPGDKVDSIVCGSDGVAKAVPVAPIVVTPAGLVITPSVGSFSASVGTTSPAITFNVANIGGSTSGILNTALGAANAADFAIADNKCVVPLAPLTICAIQVVFKPTSAGARVATLTVGDAIAGSSLATATLNGTGYSLPTLAVTGATNLGTVQVGQAGTPATYTVTNAGGAATGALTVAAGGAEFSIGSDLCSGLSLAASKTCTFTITFRPTSVGVHSAVLTASSAGTTLGTLQIQAAAASPDGGA